MWVAGAIPVALVARRADALGAAWIESDAETLRALAEAVLPSDVGASGATKVARDFQQWIDGYAENAELVHGYGTSALRFSRASPRANWAAQLERLGQRTGDGGRVTADGGPRKFVALRVAERRAIIGEELKNERLDRLPAVGSASHVAVALLAFYYGSADAADLCYGGRIGRATCRPLAMNARKPLPQAGGRS